MTALFARNTKMLWTTLGLVVGLAIGSWLGESTLGVSLGLFLYSAVGLAVDCREGRRTIFWPLLSAAAFVWVLCIALVMRA